MSGCVHVPRGEGAEQHGLWYSEDGEFYSNIGGSKKEAAIRFFYKAKINDPVFAQVNGKTVEGERVNLNSGIFREIAVMMHDSIFSDGQKYRQTDPFVDTTSITTLALEPKKIITKVSNVTSQYLNPRNKSELLPIINAMQGFAAAVLISMWAMGFISQIVNEKFTMETLLKTLMQLLCGILVITNSETLVMAFVDLGVALVNTTGQAQMALFTQLERDIVDALSNVNLVNFGFHIFSWSLGIGTFIVDIWPLYAIFLMALPFFAELICAYKICSIMIMRMLELIMRVTFAPIPLAFSAQSGFSQEATRYLRSTLACAVQPALMLVGCLFVNTISEVVMQIFGQNYGAAGPGGPLGSVAMCLSYFILSAFMGESKHLAQEIIAR